MSRTTDKYVKIKKASDTAPENEIRIRAVPRIGRYISYAASLLLEKKLDTVLIKASGNAAKSACQIAEILRHRIKDLHQVSALKTITVVDEYEPREEGLDRVSVERKLAVLEITLSLKSGVLDTNAPGYQAPLPADQVQEEELQSILAGRRGGAPTEGRGGRREREDRDDRDDRDDREGGYYGQRRGGRGGRGGFRRGRYTGRGGQGGRRDDREREGGYYGNRRDDREGGYSGNRRDDREGGYYGNRRDDREGGYYGNRRDDREGGYSGPRRGGRGGYRGGNRDY